MSRRIIVVAPGRTTTGGVELLHQLVHAINELKAEAQIIYYPWQSRDTSPAYSDYNCPVIQKNQIIESDFIILPEVYTHLSDQFPRCEIALWWMSVDNYYNSARLRFAIANRFNPIKFIRPAKLSNFSVHLCQSRYAMDHLRRHGVTDGMALSDYINTDFHSEIDGAAPPRENLILYNPAKGLRRTKMVLERSAFRSRPIVGLSRAEVVDLLRRAKLYIDFGNHPGKDRFPREAASLGCAVVTNRRGSAANPIDVPIRDDFKVDDYTRHFHIIAAKIIDDIVENYEHYIDQYSTYRQSIRNEKQLFLEEVDLLIRRVMMNREH